MRVLLLLVLCGAARANNTAQRVVVHSAAALAQALKRRQPNIVLGRSITGFTDEKLSTELLAVPSQRYLDFPEVR
jgi:hypothetical protein